MNHTILQVVSRIMIPFIQVFGIYVIVFGHLSPGGGFAGGTIIGASLIFYRIVYGKERTRQKFSYDFMMGLLCYALILYGILKGYSFLTGGNHSHLPQLPLGIPGNVLSGGYLFPLNVLVGATVTVTIYCLFTLFYEGEL
ncbi:multicomponent Na+:H+ antiporter subunit B [Anaerosolibacter carboniphilus]|uniref:Multicomponent Na+:H+ antiporter subunit B n=1 Tax=Anaerosolibacter carboniphilus TaxID=1417629 RepID=A0A841KUT5_9FIRM|nr:MnhB domain-containing protein [Anaerosolibacter carboniphilus]MBB6213945.1 multicomponent Na+:H+ antiporter subunit B [Anaerosolibacter carboniphilus]